MIQSQKGILAYAKDDESWKHHAKKMNTKGKILCDSTYMKCLKFIETES